MGYDPKMYERADSYLVLVTRDNHEWVAEVVGVEKNIVTKKFQDCEKDGVVCSMISRKAIEEIDKITDWFKREGKLPRS